MAITSPGSTGFDTDATRGLVVADARPPVRVELLGSFAPIDPAGRPWARPPRQKVGRPRGWPAGSVEPVSQFVKGDQLAPAAGIETWPEGSILPIWSRSRRGWVARSLEPDLFLRFDPPGPPAEVADPLGSLVPAVPA